MGLLPGPGHPLFKFRVWDLRQVPKLPELQYGPLKRGARPYGGPRGSVQSQGHRVHARPGGVQTQPPTQGTSSDVPSTAEGPLPSVLAPGHPAVPRFHLRASHDSGVACPCPLTPFHPSLQLRLRSLVLTASRNDGVGKASSRDENSRNSPISYGSQTCAVVPPPRSRGLHGLPRGLLQLRHQMSGRVGTGARAECT